MEFDNYTDRSKGFIASAQTTANRSGHQQLCPEHILKVLMEDNEGLASNLIQTAGGNAKKIYQDVLTCLKGVPEVKGSGASQTFISSNLTNVFGKAEKLANDYEYKTVA